MQQHDTHFPGDDIPGDILNGIDTWLEAHAQDMAKDILSLIRIDSSRGTPMDGMPYGEGPLRALEAGAALMRQYGLDVKHFQNRVVTGDATRMASHLDILAHLDVVPGGVDWTVCEPFSPVIRDNVIYGRGAADDKGPAMAALYAIRSVLETGVNLSRNVRLILGSDEECGSSDIVAYYQDEPEAPMTFSPDANWPVVNTEKGRLKVTFASNWEHQEAMPIVSEGYAGEKENVVPGAARARVAGITAAQAQAAVDALRKPVSEGGIGEVQVTILEAGKDGLSIAVKGVPCHAAHPELGSNALTALLRLLSALPMARGPVATALDELVRLFPHGETDGASAGIAAEDEVSGALTLAFSMFRLSEAGLTATLDCRVPICADESFLRKGMLEALSGSALEISDWSYSPPHHVPADSTFIKTLLQCYTDVTGKTGTPIAIGGGTYVHHLKNGVAFGCEETGVDHRMHGPDEFATLSELVQSARIFARVIVRLCGSW